MSGDLKQVESQFLKLDRKQKELFPLISTISEKAYYTQPTSNSWSIAQAANHLYLSESSSLSYLKKKMAYPTTIPHYQIKSWGALAALKFSFSSPFKFKAPPKINMWDDQPILSQTDLIEKWTALRITLFEFIRLHQPEFGSHLVFKHPFVGRLTMYQMLIFLNDHMRRHQKQMYQISQKLKD